MKNWGLRTRVLLLALAPVTLLTFALAGYFGFRLAQGIEDDLKAHGQGLTRQLAVLSEAAAATGDLAALQAITRAALVEQNVTGVYVHGRREELLAASGNALGINFRLPAGDRPQLIFADASRYLFSAPIRQMRYFGDDPFLQEGHIAAGREETAPLGAITLEISRAAAQRRLQEAILFLALAVLVVLAASGLLALLLARQVTRPILALEAAVVAMGEGQLDTRLVPQGGGDLRQLEEGFNAMAGAIAEHREELESRVRAATAALALDRDDAQRASAAKSRFLAAASHDLRQPLHALSLFAADLLRSPLTPAQLRLARQIDESIRSMTGLLDALLDISRLDVGGITAHQEPVALQGIFNRISTAFARSAEDRGLRFRCRPTTLAVRTDRVLFERLLANLVANAIEYTPRGTILIAARRRDGLVRIEVRDSGIGIPADYHKAIFEEFYQVGNPAREAGKGLGLGLAIVERVRRIINARVEVRSQEGAGATFSCSLPLAALPPAENLPTPAAEARTIWLVGIDDGLLRQQIRSWGWRAETAVSIEAACQYLTPGNGIIVAAEHGAAGALEPVFHIHDQDGIRHELAAPLRPAKLRALAEALTRPVHAGPDAGPPSRPATNTAA